MLDREEWSLDVGLNMFIEEILTDIGDGFAAHDASDQNENIKATPFCHSSVDE